MLQSEAKRAFLRRRWPSDFAAAGRLSPARQCCAATCEFACRLARPRKGRRRRCRLGDGFREGAFHPRGAPEANPPSTPWRPSGRAYVELPGADGFSGRVVDERPRIRGTARRMPVILDLLKFCAGAAGKPVEGGFPRAFRSSRLGSERRAGRDGEAADRSSRIEDRRDAPESCGKRSNGSRRWSRDPTSGCRQRGCRTGRRPLARDSVRSWKRKRWRSRRSR